MISDRISFLEVNGLNNEIFLEIKRIRYLWRQRSVTNSIFKEITKIERYQRITKDFLQDHIKSINSRKVGKIIYQINRDKDTYKRNIESIDEKDRRFSVFPNDFPPVSIRTLINEKNPRLISLKHAQKSQTNKQQKRANKLAKQKVV